MPNLSQIKRERMLAFLQKIKDEHRDDDDMLIALGEIESELTSKKYGLVWEQHEEAVDVMMRDHIPVFTEVPEREITAAPGQGYNFILEGDNLHSLHLLSKTHRGKIDVIYIDPPYNTKNKDFIYDDKRIDATDGFQHSKWLSFMAERLQIAGELLSKDGVMAISIGYQEVNNLMSLCQELFSTKNVVCVTVQTSSGNAVQNGFTYVQEYIVFITPPEFEPFELASEKKDYSTPYHGMNLSGFNQTQRPNQAYPIFVDMDGRIVGCGKSLQERIDDGSYEGCLRRIRSCRAPVKERKRKTDIERILYRRGQEDVYDPDELYALFQTVDPEILSKLRSAIREERWHLMPEAQREAFLLRWLPGEEFEEWYDLLMDFRQYGFRVLGDVVGDIDDANTGSDRKQLHRVGDSEAFASMMQAYIDHPRAKYYRDAVAKACRELLKNVVSLNQAVRYIVALGRRDLLWDLVSELIEKNVLEVKENA